MNLLTGIIKNGQVVLPRPADLPDGTEVTVRPSAAGRPLGIPDDEWPTDPEEIARMLARIDRVEPFEMTPDEEADVAAWRLKVKDYTLRRQHEAVDGLFE